MSAGELLVTLRRQPRADQIPLVGEEPGHIAIGDEMQAGSVA